MAGDEFAEPINDFLSQLSQRKELDGYIPTGWFIITEWMNPDEGFAIFGWSDGVGSPLKYRGMLEHALDEKCILISTKDRI